MVLFRNVFKTKFNISLGYPCKDTRSPCDIYKVQIAPIHAKQAKVSDENGKVILNEKTV